MLNPSGLRKQLCEFTLRKGHHAAAAVKDDGARTGSTLVQGEQVVWHIKPILRRGIIGGQYSGP